MAVLAHELDLYTNSGCSVHYKPSQISLVPDLYPLICLAVAQALLDHPILFAVPIIPYNGDPYFARLPSIDLQKVTSFVHRQGPVLEDAPRQHRPRGVC